MDIRRRAKGSTASQRSPDSGERLTRRAYSLDVLMLTVRWVKVLAMIFDHGLMTLVTNDADAGMRKYAMTECGAQEDLAESARSVLFNGGLTRRGELMEGDGTGRRCAVQ